MTADKDHGGRGDGGETALIALGANLSLGNQPPEATLRAALAVLGDAGFAPSRVSAFYRTPCFPAGAGPDYVNAAALVPVAAGVTAGAVLEALHRIEAGLGRERQIRWGARTLDLDLIALGAQVLPDGETQDRWRALPSESRAKITPDVLILPHPRMQERAFVLVPLAEIAPEWRHPRLGLRVADMLAALDPGERAAVRRL